jgi:hypothetical protein
MEHLTPALRHTASLSLFPPNVKTPQCPHGMTTPQRSPALSRENFRTLHESFAPVDFSRSRQAGGDMKRISPAYIVTMALCVASASLPAHAEFYKCRDASGKVTYSDTGCGVGTVGASIPIQENTMDSYGDRIRMEEQAEMERHRNVGRMIGSSSHESTSTTQTQNYAAPSSYAYPYYSTGSAASSSSQCSTRACQLEREDKVVRAVPANPGSPSTGSGSHDSGHDRNDSASPSRQSSDSGRVAKTVRAVKDKDKD